MHAPTAPDVEGDGDEEDEASNVYDDEALHDYVDDDSDEEEEEESEEGEEAEAEAAAAAPSPAATQE